MWKESRSDGVATATFHRPPMNYFTTKDVIDLTELVVSWSDPSVSAVVLAGGVPEKFITHFSAEEILEGLQDPAGLISHGPVRNERVNALFRALNDLPKPVIAGLNGDTMGFGFELALACDFRIGQQGNFRYGLPEIQLGIIPGAGGTQRLAKLLGTGRAMDLILRPRLLTPEEALSEGLLSMVSEDALLSSQELAARLAKLAPVAVAMVKRSIYRGSDLPLASGLTIETDASFRAKVAPEALHWVERYVALPLDERRKWLDRERDFEQ